MHTKAPLYTMDTLYEMDEEALRAHLRRVETEIGFVTDPAEIMLLSKAALVTAILNAQQIIVTRPPGAKAQPSQVGVFPDAMIEATHDFISARVALMGRGELFGFVRWERIMGINMLRVTVPGNNNQGGYTMYFMRGAVYSIAPIPDDDQFMKMLEANRPAFSYKDNGGKYGYWPPYPEGDEE